MLEIPKFICNLFSCVSFPYFDKTNEKQKIRCSSTTSKVLFTIDAFINHSIISIHTLCKTDLMTTLSILKEQLPNRKYLDRFFIFQL